MYSLYGGTWGTGVNPEDYDGDIHKNIGENAVIEAGELAIVTPGVHAPRVVASCKWAISAARVLTSASYRKLANVIMEYDTKYAGYQYMFCMIAYDEDEDQYDSDGEHTLYDVDEGLYDSFVDYPFITTVYSLYRPISVLRRQHGVWASITTTIMDITNMQLYPFDVYQPNRHFNNIRTVILTDTYHGKCNYSYTSQSFMANFKNVRHTETVYLVSTGSYEPEPHVCTAHLHYFANKHLIDHSHIAMHIYEPASESDLIYDNI